METSTLPALADLQADPNIAFKNDQLNLLLNQPVPAKWVKKHPTLGHNYLPIDKVEFLLTTVFKQWRIEVLDTKLMLNSVAVTVRVHYMNPLTREWNFHDGVGAATLQLDANSAPSDISKIKSGAVVMALPIAKSIAIKDAADHLGSLFGRDLSRKDTVEFAGFYNKEHGAAQPVQDQTVRQDPAPKQQPPAPPAPPTAPVTQASIDASIKNEQAANMIDF